MTADTYAPPPRSDERRVLGHAVPRIEDPPLVTGRGLFAGDVNFAHQLHMRVVRSNHAHARIVSIDAAAARALPGVVAVWTIDDIADLPPIDFRDPTVGCAETLPATGTGARARPLRRRSDRSRVRGRPVHRRGRGRSRIPLTVERACRWCSMPTIRSANSTPGHNTEPTDRSNTVSATSTPLFLRAHAVVELDLRIGRHSGVPMETRGAIGRYDAAYDILELHGAAKVPHRNKDTLMRMLKRTSRHAASARGSYRRRLRHPRRALSRGCPGAAWQTAASAGR